MAKRPLQIPDRSQITDDTPLRLAVAAALAYPDGSMTVDGLRRERDAGRLVTELTAGKEFTTLGDIARMRELCRRKVAPRPQIGSRPAQIAEQEDLRRATAALQRSIERINAAEDEKRKAAREARQRERQEAKPARLRTTAGPRSSKGRQASLTCLHIRMCT